MSPSWSMDITDSPNSGLPHRTIRSPTLERTVEISTLGRCSVNGVDVPSRRAVELAALLVLSGGEPNVIG